jgi:hypothetical protein
MSLYTAEGIQMLLNNDVVQVQWRGLCFGQRIIMNQHYHVTGDFPLLDSFFQDAQRIINAVRIGGVINVEAAYLACLPPEYRLFDVNVQRIRAARSAYFGESSAVGFPGTNADSATVANDSACITLRTQQAGRKQVANMHIGPVPDAVSVAGLLTAAYKVTLSALGTKLVVSGVPVGSGSLISPTIMHVAGGDDLVQQFHIGPQSRVQRRRTVGVGE